MASLPNPFIHEYTSPSSLTTVLSWSIKKVPTPEATQLDEYGTGTPPPTEVSYKMRDDGDERDENALAVLWNY